MIDVIAPKHSSLRPGVVEATMFLKLNMRLIFNNLADVAKSPIWNTLIPSHPKLLDDINDSDDNENEEDDEDDDLSSMLVESEETDYTC
jgi:hypothetical protein